MPLKFKESHVIRATYRIVTPMFIGDAEQKASGISPASVKGALRFWWRALNWGRVWEANKKEKNTALKALHAEEAELFGSSADNGKAAKFTLRVNADDVKITRNTDWPRGGNDPSGYLGLGLWESGSHAKGNFQPHREYIAEGQLFSVELSALKILPDDGLEQLQDALMAWGLLGGLGSRARRAFGSVALERLDQESFKFSCTTDYEKAVNKLFSKSRLKTVVQPPFSAFCKDTKFAISQVLDAEARKAHAGLGNAFKNYRGQPSPLRGTRKRVFGMPYSGGGKEEAEARRASPLLFHVHSIGDQFVGSVLFLPADFHNDPKLEKVDYSLASGFLKQLPEVV